MVTMLKSSKLVVLAVAGALGVLAFGSQARADSWGFSIRVGDGPRYHRPSVPVYAPPPVVYQPPVVVQPAPVPCPPPVYTPPACPPRGPVYYQQPAYQPPVVYQPPVYQPPVYQQPAYSYPRYDYRNDWRRDNRERVEFRFGYRNW